MFEKEFTFLSRILLLHESPKWAPDLPAQMTVLGTMDSCQLGLIRISDKPVLLKLR